MSKADQIASLQVPPRAIGGLMMKVSRSPGAANEFILPRNTMEKADSHGKLLTLKTSSIVQCFSI